MYLCVEFISSFGFYRWGFPGQREHFIVPQSLEGASPSMKMELGSLQAPGPPTGWFTLGEGRLSSRNVIGPVPPPATSALEKVPGPKFLCFRDLESKATII